MTDDRRDPETEIGNELRDAFGTETDAELADHVPDHLVAATWPRLAVALATRTPAHRRRWLPQTLAAALALMIALSGWLALENQQLRSHDLDSAGFAPAPATTAGPRAITAGELIGRLTQLPPETPVLTAAQAEQLVRRGQPLLYAVVRGPRLDALVADGVTAAEALTVLRRLDADTPIRLGDTVAGRS